MGGIVTKTLGLSNIVHDVPSEEQCRVHYVSKCCITLLTKGTVEF